MLYFFILFSSSQLNSVRLQLNNFKQILTTVYLLNLQFYIKSSANYFWPISVKCRNAGVARPYWTGMFLVGVFRFRVVNAVYSFASCSWDHRSRLAPSLALRSSDSSRMDSVVPWDGLAVHVPRGDPTEAPEWSRPDETGPKNWQRQVSQICPKMINTEWSPTW
jgi:hypothetical protein